MTYPLLRRHTLTHDDLLELAAAYSALLAAARAAVAAQELGESDPVGYIRGYLADHGQLPPPGASPSRLLALAVVPTTCRAEAC